MRVREVWRIGAPAGEKETNEMMNRNQNRSRSTYGKTNLVDDVTARTQGYSRRQVAEIVDAMMETIKSKVASGQNVTLTGFGTFRRSERAARRGTNIRTRQPINIPAQSSVRFTPGSDFKAAVSGRSSARRSQTSQQRERGGQTSQRGSSSR
jgi:DNA-binding protein HU-beta